MLDELQRLFEQLEEYRQYRAGQDQPPGHQPRRRHEAAARHVHLGRGGARQVADDGRVLQGLAPPPQAPRALPRVHARDPRAHARALRARRIRSSRSPTEIARELRLLAFDEFHVSDIADAMILARLLELLIEKGVVLVHDLQLPARRPLSQRPAARALPAGDRDPQARPRRGATWAAPPTTAAACSTASASTTRRSTTQADANLARFFEAMTKATYAENGTIEVGGRAIAFRRRAKGVIWFDFAELFEKPRSQVDYLEIASALPHGADLGRAAHAARADRRGAPLHLAGGRVLRPAREAGALGRGAARGAGGRRRPRSTRAAERWCARSSRAPRAACARCSRRTTFRASTPRRRTRGSCDEMHESHPPHEGSRSSRRAVADVDEKPAARGRRAR